MHCLEWVAVSSGWLTRYCNSHLSPAAHVLHTAGTYSNDVYLSWLKCGERYPNPLINAKVKMLRVLSKGFEVKMSTGGSKMSSDSNGLDNSTGLKVVNNMKFTTLLSFSQSPRIPTPAARVDHPQLSMPGGTAR